jgi:signal transduction histidine kinase
MVTLLPRYKDAAVRLASAPRKAPGSGSAGASRRLRPAHRLAASAAGRDRIHAITAGSVLIAASLTLHAAGVLERVQGTQAGSLFISGLISLAGVAGSAAWFAWRRARSTTSELKVFQRDDQERRAIAAIGLGTTWDLDLQRVYTRFAQDLRQLINFDRLAMTSARPTGVMELVFVHGDSAGAARIGAPVPPESDEPDGLTGLSEFGYLSRLTVPFLAINGTLTLRSRQPDAYGKREVRLLRQAVAHASPGVANSLVFEASQRQLRERTVLAEIGKAATGAPDLLEIFPAVRKSLAALINFDHMGVVLVSSTNDEGQIAYWQVNGMLGINTGATAQLDSAGLPSEAIEIGASPTILRVSENSPHAQAGPGRAWLQSPLRVQDQLVGVLLLSGQGQEWAGEPERLLVKQVSLQIAPAVRNAQLLAVERGLKHELDLQNQELHAAQQSKNRFLSAVSHELRTPLAIISGFVDLLGTNPAGNLDSEQLDSLSIMARNSTRLGQLIDDLLDISRIGANTFKVQRSVFNVTDLLKTIIGDAQAYAGDKDQAIQHRLTGDPVWLNADPARLSQLVTNLLTNASKYSGPGTEIELSATWDATEFHLSVRDHGIGISAEDQEKLFSPFYRVDNPVTRTVPGTGLGLYISKTIVGMHGGRIWLDSVPGAGTTVHFIIPCVYQSPSAGDPPEWEELLHPRSRLFPDRDSDETPLTAA